MLRPHSFRRILIGFLQDFRSQDFFLYWSFGLQELRLQNPEDFITNYPNFYRILDLRIFFLYWSFGLQELRLQTPEDFITNYPIPEDSLHPVRPLGKNPGAKRAREAARRPLLSAAKKIAIPLPLH